MKQPKDATHFISVPEHGKRVKYYVKKQNDDYFIWVDKRWQGFAYIEDGRIPLNKMESPKSNAVSYYWHPSFESPVKAEICYQSEDVTVLRTPEGREFAVTTCALLDMKDYKNSPNRIVDVLISNITKEDGQYIVPEDVMVSVKEYLKRAH